MIGSLELANCYKCKHVISAEVTGFFRCPFKGYKFIESPEKICKRYKPDNLLERRLSKGLERSKE